MKTDFTIKTRCFPVTIRDNRTGEVSQDHIVLDKDSLRACQLVGQSSTDLIQRIYNRQGFRVLEIGTPEHRSIGLNLEEIWKLHSKTLPQKKE